MSIHIDTHSLEEHMRISGAGRDRMRDNIRKLLLAGVITIMVFGFAGCSDSDSGEKSATENTNASTEATETAETDGTATDDYDILDGFNLVEKDDITLLYGNGFVLTMPDDDWGYEQTSPTCLQIYSKDAREDGYEGHLVSIMAFDPDDTSYEEFPEYSVAGRGKTVDKVFVALFPTDVQYNPDDPDQAEDYNELFTHVKKIAEGMADSPFQITE